MFAEHQPAIARSAGTAEGLARVCQFVALTVQQPLTHAAEQMAALRAGDPVPPPVTGVKSRALAAFWDRRADLHWHLRDLRDHAGDPEVEALVYLARWPGLGLRKAGFVLQMAWGRVGCLDTHNVKRLGLHPRAHDVPPPRATPKLWRRRARSYRDACTAAGGAPDLWDAWCRYVAGRQPFRYDAAEHVSRVHCEALGV